MGGLWPLLRLTGDLGTIKQRSCPAPRLDWWCLSCLLQCLCPCGLQADIVILTNNNPRTEDPSGIVADIQAGYPNILLQVRCILFLAVLHLLHVRFGSTALGGTASWPTRLGGAETWRRVHQTALS